MLKTPRIGQNIPEREYLSLTAAPDVNIFLSGNMNIRNTKQLGAAVRARRKELKVTQKDVALTCCTGLRFIIDLEKGKPTCQIGKVLQVIQALGLDCQLTGAAGDGTKRSES